MIRFLTRTFSENKEVRDILLLRPEKHSVWALGGKLMKIRRIKFKTSEFPSIKRLKKYLEIEKIENVRVFNIREYNRQIPMEIFILGSGHSPRHVSKVGSNLVRSLKEAGVPGSDLFTAEGLRDSGWMHILLRTISINLVTPEIREEMDLDDPFKEPTEKDIREFALATFSRKK